MAWRAEREGNRVGASERDQPMQDDDAKTGWREKGQRADEGKYQDKHSPTKLVSPRSPELAKPERRLQFSNYARMKLIPADQFPSRPNYNNRIVRSPNRRLWVLFRLYQLGGHILTKPSSREYEYVEPNTPWPIHLGPPPPPPTYKEQTTYIPPFDYDLDRN